MVSQIVDLQRLTRTLDGISERVSDLAPVVRLMAPVAAGEVRQRFNAQQSPEGMAWLPLRHRRPRGGKLALLDTGKLRASISGKAEGTDTIVVGTNVEYARLHQFGGVIVPRRARMLAIPISPEAQRTGSPRRFQRPLHSRRRVLGETVNGRFRAHYVLVRKVTVPARPFLGFSEDFIAKLESLALIYVLDGSL